MDAEVDLSLCAAEVVSPLPDAMETADIGPISLGTYDAAVADRLACRSGCVGECGTGPYRARWMSALCKSQTSALGKFCGSAALSVRGLPSQLQCVDRHVAG